jgi:hypothetical protein
MNFKKMSCRLLIAFGFVASATSAMAQSSATTNGNATATVIRPITLTASRDLAFGKVVPAGTVGTMVLTAANTTSPSFTGGVSQPGSQAAGTFSSAQFDVTGEGGFTYTITIPASATASTLTGPTGSAPMTVDSWSSDIATTAGAGLLTGTTSGAQTFYVGGTLHLGVNQAPGSYTGVFPVTVAYN